VALSAPMAPAVDPDDDDFGKPRAAPAPNLFDGRPISPTCRPSIGQLRIARRPKAADFRPRHEALRKICRWAPTPHERARPTEQPGSSVSSRCFRLKERMTQRGGTLSGASSRCWPIAGVDEPALAAGLLDEPSLASRR